LFFSISAIAPLLREYRAPEAFKEGTMITGLKGTAKK
jgi:hypothetical protein